jgi:hypothetical protein
MNNIISYIKYLFINNSDNENISLNNEYIYEEYIINKYYLDRLFDNFIDDKSPKHYLNLYSFENEKNELLKYITETLYKLINKLQNTKYKYFVKNDSISGNHSFYQLKHAIIYGLYIINDYHEEKNINIFTEYIFEFLIEMFKSINSDRKILRDTIKYENIINSIYNKLFLYETNIDNKLFFEYNMINSQKINNIIFFLLELKTSDKIFYDKLNIINSILVEIK